MNILLIGGAGFIGSNIIAYLCRHKEIRVSVLEPAFSSLHRIKEYPVQVYHGCLEDTDMLESIIVGEHIDTVVHLVSTIVPGSGFGEFQREFSNVIFPSIRLMEVCSRKGVKFVYFSSGGTIYGDHKEKYVPFTEECPIAPISYYGWSKQMMENSVLYMHRTQNLRYLIVRPSNPYGEGQNLHGNQGFIAVALGKILSREKITVWGDGSSIRDYIYIDDLGKAVSDLLWREDIVNTTLNIGSGKGYSINEIIDVLRNIVEEDFLVEYVPARQVDVSSVVLDISRLNQLVDFNPLGIMEGIGKFYKHVRDGR